MEDDPETSSAAGTVRGYYDALRDGAALAPFFADGDVDVDAGADAGDVVKCGVFSRRLGAGSVAAGLAEQTDRTEDWRVESRDLRTTERSDHARFADLVDLAWTDLERDERYEFETRWTGVLERPGPTGAGSGGDGSAATADWQFVAMHVSTAEER